MSIQSRNPTPQAMCIVAKAGSVSDFVVRTDALEPDPLLAVGSQLGDVAPVRVLSALGAFGKRLRRGAETIRAVEA